MALKAVARLVSYAPVSESRWARQPPQHQHMSRLRLSRSLISHKIYITFGGPFAAAQALVDASRSGGNLGTMWWPCPRKHW